MNPTPVTIVGAGWAGLAAGVTLSANRIPVRIFEAAKQIGGRGRNVQLDGTELDNGQHLMIGAYHELLGLLDTLQLSEQALFARIPQQLKILDAAGGAIDFELNLPRLPAPLHLLFGMLSSRPMSIGDKFSTLLRFNRLLNTPLAQDCSVSHWLASAGLPETYVERLLKPLCLAALTTHPDQASATIFQTVLLQTFQGARANTDLLIARRNIGDLFPTQARAFIEDHGGELLTTHRVRSIETDEQRVRAIQVNDESVAVDQLVLATSPVATQRLLAPITACADVTEQLNRFEYEAITTVYLHYAQDIQLQEPMLGLRGASAEWLFDRRLCGQPGVIAGVISAVDPALPHEPLATRLAAELSQLFGWPQPHHHRVIVEKRAALRCTPNIDKIRPGIQTALANLRLCGDYVHSEGARSAGLPSTLEAALRSGVKCARQLIKESR